jgi:hypothetical protein
MTSESEEAFWSAGSVRERGVGRTNQRGVRQWQTSGSQGNARPWQNVSNQGVGRQWKNFNNYQSNGQRGRYQGPGTYRNNGGGYSNQNDRGKDMRSVNPRGPDGKPILCKSCGSFRHLLANCPDSWENMAMASVNITDQQDTEDVFCNMLTPNASQIEEATLLTGLGDDVKKFSIEARKCAVLDSACSSTVCGECWLDDYLTSLEEKDRDKVSRSTSSKLFRFGGGEKLKSEGLFKIPAYIAGKEVTINTDVVKSDIPLLLSKYAMKQAGVKLNLQDDTAEILGVHLILNETSSGHYCIPIDKGVVTAIESVYAVNIHNSNPNQKYKILVKLHRQFAHPAKDRFITLLKDAKVWDAGLTDILNTIYEKCEICKLYMRTPSRPVVAMPMASRFNEKVCIDLKKWRDRWILHMIDMWSRFSVSVFISRKQPSEVIDKIMTCWIGSAFGVMESLLSDNGGEFSSNEMREVCSILNVEKITTAAESPFQNGLCERNHAIVDNMLLKLEQQCPCTPTEVLLSWANMAKNSLQMWHGYSSYQLVFGKNPNLPNVMTAQLPALEGTSTSEVLVKHLNSLHAAREAFIESEADERVRRALRSKIRASERKYNHGDRVYYKRENSERWLGPAKVIFQDGKVVFVRHGSTFVRVSPNRLNPMGNVHVQGEDYNTIVSRGDEFSDQQQSTKFVAEQNITKTVQSDKNSTEEIMGKPSEAKESLTSETETRQSTVKYKPKIVLNKDEKILYKINESDE